MNTDYKLPKKGTRQFEKRKKKFAKKQKNKGKSFSFFFIWW